MRVFLDQFIFTIEIIVAVFLGSWIWATMFSAEIEASAVANEINNPLVSDCSYTVGGKYSQFRASPVCKTVHLSEKRE